MIEPILTVSDLSKRYPLKNGNHTGIEKITFSMEQGEILGLAGESGSGKSTLGKILAGLEQKDNGKITFRGKSIQMIFQNPASSLDFKMRVGEIVEEPLVIQKVRNKALRRKNAMEKLALVGLSEEYYHRFPSELSGGQIQRVAIARTLMLSPDLLIADEPTASLDVSVQAQLMKLFLELNQTRNMSILLISHDLGLLKQMCRRIGILQDGKWIEVAAPEILWKSQKPETRKLLDGILPLEAKLS